MTTVEHDALEAVYRFVAGYMQENGYAPTFREIGAAVGMPSTATVSKALDSLREQGRVEWVSGKARTLRLLSKS